MSALREKQEARIWALREVTSLIASAKHNGNGPTVFAHHANSYTSHEKKALIDSEIEAIWWQLINRLEKLEREVSDADNRTEAGV